MSNYFTTLRLSVRSWSQELSHGEKWPPQRFLCIARASENEDLQLKGGPDIRTLEFHLYMFRGEFVPSNRERPLGTGIGELVFAEKREPETDSPGSSAFFHGWYWMPEALYDEIWVQVRGQTWQDCSIEIDIEPVEFDAPEFCWDVTKQPMINVTRASVRFDRRQPEPPPPPEPPKRRGLFG